MNQSVRALVAVDEGVDHALVQSALPAHQPEIQIVGIVDGLEEGWSTLQETATDLLIIACAGYSDRVLFLIDGAVKQKSDRPVVVFITAPPDGFARRIFEAGADDILVLPINSDEVGFALQKAMARKQGTAVATGVALSPMIVVLGPKGGTGKTVTSSNLAVSLAIAGNKVAVVDLDLQFGDVGLSLGLAPEKTVYDLVKAGGSIDGDKVDGYLAKHVSGVEVLMAPTRPDHAGVIRTEFLRDIYTTLRSTKDFVIVDTPPGFTPEVIASIDSSSHVCMVGMLDSLSLKNTKLGLDTLELMGYSPERVRLVLNRADSRVGITHDDVLAVVGHMPDVFVPSDRDIPRSINEGMPIVMAKDKSEAARAFRKLASLYEPVNQASTNGKRRIRLVGRKH
jgi:MinD-like ATPase involved in chromosome partitioning or flagellar assembly/CheY-like chemotaxis protein